MAGSADVGCMDGFEAEAEEVRVVIMCRSLLECGLIRNSALRIFLPSQAIGHIPAPSISFTSLIMYPSLFCMLPAEVLGTVQSLF
jgi:hypothetical protein